MLTEKQQLAIDTFKDGKNIFITGRGGTGKSFLVKEILRNRDGKKVGITALTGCAAILLGFGATTLHSWCGIGMGDESIPDILKKMKKVKKLKSRWLETDVLIIDEVSMLDKYLFEKINKLGQIIRENEKPFGGIQLVLLGDFCQLPPVNKATNEDLFVFLSKDWQTCIDTTIYLTENMRQKDSEFDKILDKIRMGECDDEAKKVLESRMNLETEMEIKPTKIFALNKNVDEINNRYLRNIEGEEIVYDSMPIYIPNLRSKNSVNEDNINSIVEMMNKNYPYKEKLVLKKGAQVMLIFNLDIEAGLVNGSRGIVSGFIESSDRLPNNKRIERKFPVVKFKNGVVRTMYYNSWDNLEHIGLSVSQIPLTLSFCNTIHKMQGQTTDMIDVDIGSGIFECGQTYVALSRVKSLEGLFISDFEAERIKIHPKVKDYYKNLLL